MRELINLVEKQQLNEATYDQELDKIVAKVLRGSAGFSKGKMIDRDLVLNKGFDMALALDNTKDEEPLSLGNILGKIKDFVVTDDFLEKQYFGKIAKRLRLKGMFMHDGKFITTDVDEHDRYQIGDGKQEDAERQNNMGILPGRVAKKFDIDLKFKGSADDAFDPDSKPDKELRLQSNGSRINVNIDRTKPYVDEVKDGKKIRTYGTPEDLKKRFGDDAKIMGLPPKEPVEPAKADRATAMSTDKGIVINDDNIMKYVDRYEELISKATKNSVQFASQFKSVFGSMANILKEEKLSDKEEQELQQIVDAMKAAIKNKTLNDANIGFAQDIVDNWKYDKEMAIASEKEKVAQAVRQASKDAEANKFSGLPKGYRAERDGDKVLIYKDDDLVAQYNIQDGDSNEEIKKQVLKMAQMNAGSDTAVASDQGAAKGAESTGALAKFAKSGKGGLANDPDEVDAIKELQERLKDMGIGMTVDGKYSKGTVDAVKRVQEMLGEKQDGDAGPKTIGAILKMGNIPGVITFYDDLKRLAELSKKIKKESNDFRYVLTILEGGNLLEALSAAEQKEYDDLMKKHQAKFDDPEYQVALPKSVQDLMSQVIKQGGGAAANQDAGKDAERGLADTNKKPEIIGGWFVPFPKSLQKDIIGGTRDYFINLYTTKRGEIYISRSSEKQKTKRLYVKTDSQNKKIRDYLDSVGIEMKIGDPRLGPKGDASATASNQEAGQDAEDKKPTYDTQYSGDVKKDVNEYFKGIALGLDPDDEMDDFLDATEKTVDSNAGNSEKIYDVDLALKNMLQILNSNTRIPASADPETRMVRNLDIESRKVQMAIQALRDFRDNDVVTAMKAEPKDDEETSTASDSEAGKDAETTGTFDVSKVAQKLYQATKFGFTTGATNEEAIHDALSSITTPTQFEQVDKLFKRYYKKGDIEFMIKDEMSGNDLKKAQDIIAKIKSSEEKEAEPKTTKTEPTQTSAKDLGDGKILFPMPTDGDWKKVTAALGFKSVTDMVVVQKATGVTDEDGKKLDIQDVLQYPMTYAGKPIVWTKNPATSGVTSNSNSVKSDDEVPSATAQTNAKTDTTQQTDKAASNQAAGQSTETKPSVEPRPEVTASGGHTKKNQTRRQQAWDKKHGATHNPDGSPKNENKEYDMNKKVNEAASMNISMSGDNAGEVSELVSILRNAGMQDAKPVTPDMMPPMAKTISMVDEPPMMDKPEGPSPCGMGEDEVEEAEWDNSPDEEYKDNDYMNNDIAGGLNRPKDKGALRAKDPAIHNEDVDKYKSELRKDLENLYKTI